MDKNISQLIDFEKVNILLEGYNKCTGFVTAILDLDGKVLSKSGWRQICTDFHRVHPETSKLCTISDTELAGKMAKGEKYHFYKCLNGLVDVAVPIVINGEHVANLFSGQFFFEEPDKEFFRKQAEKYGFNNAGYLDALEKVPVVSKEKVKTAMDFLLNMTQLISEMSFQKLKQLNLTKAIQANERMLRLFVEHSPASIAMFDKNMRYLIASKRFKMDYNLGDQEIIGRSHYEVFPDIPDRWKEIHKRCLAGETIRNNEDMFPREDGSIDWVRWEIRPWFETPDQIGGIILFSEVITEAKKSIEKLNESEKYNRQLFNQSLAGLALTTMDGRLVDVNPAFASIIGYSVNETKHLTYWDITPEEYGDKEQEVLRSLQQTGKYGPYEKEYIHKEGHRVPVQLSGNLIERNGVQYIWSSVEDITERIKTEGQLKESESRFSQVMQSVNLVSIILEPDATLSFCNNYFLKISGYKKEEIIGKNWFEIFIPAEIANKIKKVFLDAVSNRNLVSFMENEIKAKNGELKTIAWNNTLLKNENGEILGVASLGEDITEKHKIKQALFESEYKYRNLLDVAPIGIAVHAEGKIVFANPAGVKILGAKNPDELIGKPIGKIIHPDNLVKSHERIQRMMAGEEGLYPVEDVYLRTDGSPIDVEVIASPIQFEKKQAVQVVVSDSSERKLAERKIRESEEQFRTIFEQSASGMVLTSTNGQLHRVNVPFCEMLGYTREELEGKHFNDITVPEDREIGNDVVRKMIAGELKKVAFEKRYLKKSGEIIWVRIHTAPLFNEAGQINYFVGQMEDVTPRIESERRLKSSENKFKALVEQSLTGIYIFEKERFIYVNQRFCEIFGYSEEEILTGMKPTDVISAEERKRAAENIDRRLSGEVKSVHYTARGNHKTGKQLWVEIHGTHLELEEKDVITGTVLDITSRVIAEEEVRKLNEGLELKIEERTSELETKISEIERMNKLFVGRELRMKELKEKIKEMEDRLKKA